MYATQTLRTVDGWRCIVLFINDREDYENDPDDVRHSIPVAEFTEYYKPGNLNSSNRAKIKVEREAKKYIHQLVMAPALYCEEQEEKAWQAKRDEKAIKSMRKEARKRAKYLEQLAHTEEVGLTEDLTVPQLRLVLSNPWNAALLAELLAEQQRSDVAEAEERALEDSGVPSRDMDDDTPEETK